MALNLQVIDFHEKAPRMNHDIDQKNDAGSGLTTAANSPLVSGVSPPPSDSDKTTSMRVLVVEDDSSVRETLGMVLEAYQHEPDLVDSGEQAIKHLRRSWPDVMLLDLTLQGMTGEEVYEKIRSEFGKVPPTVVLSAAQQGESRARHLPGTHFLAKPYTIEQLEEILCVAAKASRGAVA